MRRIGLFLLLVIARHASAAQSSQTINFSTPNPSSVGSSPFTLNATATSGLAVSFVSTTLPVCSVSGSTLTVVGGGSCTVTASQAGDSNYLAAPDVSRTFTIFKGGQVITFGALSNAFLGDPPITLTATASSGLAVFYGSSNNSVCTVSGTTLTLVATGTCQVLAFQSGDTNYNAANPIFQSFTVFGASQTITFATISDSFFGSAPITVSPTASSTLPVTLTGTTNGVCTLSGYTVTIAGAGTCSITATQAGSSTYAPATQVIQSFNVAKATQTITFGTLSNTTFGTPAFSVNATASSTLGVSFASTTQSACTVVNSTVTLAGIGTCSIVASQSGNSNVSAATSVTQSFTVSQGSQTINFGPLSNQPRDAAAFTLNATATSGLTVTLISNTLPVCTVANTTVTIVDVGTCSITASQTGTANYTAATSVTQTFTVTPASQTITFAVLPGLTFGAVPFTVTASASSGLAVTFTSNTLPVCTVSNSTVTIVTAGTCTVVASQAGNTGFTAATSVSRSFTVAQASQTITFATLPDVTFGVSPFALTATASSGLSVSLSSTTVPVCTISGNTLTVVAAGSCSVTASQAGDGNNLVATSVSRTFNVLKASQTITFSALSNVALGTGPITLTPTASSGLAVTLTSTTTAVCTLSSATLTLVTAGACSVTASQAGDGNYSAATPVIQGFTVTPGSQTITFNAPANTTFGTAPFTVSATSTSSLAVSFASTTTSVCTVSVNTVTLAGAGTCSITASQAGDPNYSAATSVSQSFTVGKESQSITFGPLSGIALGLTPPALSATASSTLAVTFTSSTQPVCTVTGTTITLVNVGTCTVAADQPGDANYTAAPQVTQSFTVTPGSQTITFAAPPGVVFGVTPLTLVATTTSNLAITFDSATTPTVCSVSGTSVTILTVGTCTVTASQAGNASFTPASVSRSFTVSQATQIITFAAPTDVIMGVSPFALSATATSGLTVAFASASPLVCTISGVTVTVVGAGSCSVTATQAGDTNYLAATLASSSFTVARGPQTITFAALSNVAFGVAPITLAATSSASLTVSFSSGTLTVCTVSGTTLTVVAPGSCSVSASQAGDANYTAATAVTRTFAATSTQTISFPTISNQAFGTPPFELGAGATSGLQVSYASTTLSICTVSGSTVTLLAVGTCSITASQSGNSIFLAGTGVSQSFSVLAAPPCEYTLNPVGTSIPAAGGSGVLKVLTGPGCAWTATSNAGFITFTSNAAGTDSSNIGYSVASNSGASARSGTITVSGQTFTVTQFATACSFALNTPSLDFPAAGGSATISLAAPASTCSWTGTAGDPAVTITPGNGTAPSQILVTISANTNVASRSLSATIGGQTLTLNEAGKNCSVTLGASAATIPAAGGPGSVDVTTQSGCGYSTVTGPNWISITSGGTGSDPGGTLFYTVDANSTTASRTGAMNIGGQSFQVTQPGVSCEISLDTSTLGSPFASAGGAGTIGIVTNNPACSWSASTRAAWLSFNGPASGTGPGTVSLTASGNATSSARSDVVTIEGQQVGVSQDGTSCTLLLRSSSGVAPAGGGSGSVGVVAASGCAWTSSSNAPWLTIDASANTGTGDVQFTAASNVATARSGTLTVAGQTYTVNQGGAPCNFNLALASVSAPVTGVASATVAFTTNTSGCTANAVSSSSWLTVSTAFTGQAGVITYSAAVNTGPARTGYVKLGNQTFSVTEAGAGCTFTAASSSEVFGNAGGSGNIQITASGSGCTPSILLNQTWLTTGALTGPVSNVFTQPFTVTPYSSAANSVRVARFTIGGSTYIVKQTSW